MNGEKQFEQPIIKKIEREEGKPLGEIITDKARLNINHTVFRIEDYYKDLIKYNEELLKHTNKKKKKELLEKIKETEKNINELEKEVSIVNKELAAIPSDVLDLELKIIGQQRKELNTHIEKAEERQKEVSSIKARESLQTEIDNAKKGNGGLLLQQQTIKQELEKRNDISKLAE